MIPPNDALDAMEADRVFLAETYADALARDAAFDCEYAGLDVKAARTKVALFCIEAGCESRKALATFHDTLRQFAAEFTASRVGATTFRSRIHRLIEARWGKSKVAPW